ncbi:terminase large subunit [Pleomorphomonas carboxyditropha]|uniref:Terminase n=1 Tax=Pleomorphomonas carboxyditropha TaxID=2023338 RepID=A0A2G9WY79_9HYPH|nr:terminase TerL endonuclease subunit [Pleomorphomonas carboxyditropha]PIO99655.1 terminase [Pleomorphomonas carboxyditropha]
MLLPTPSTNSVSEVLRPGWLFDDSPIPDPCGFGERAVRFAGLLKHPKSRLPQRALRLDPWHERLMRRIYGPTDENGNRQVRTVYLQVGKGSRKTSLAAVLALIHTFGPERTPRGQNYVVAADRAQARVAFEEAASIIEEVPQLAGASRPIDSKNRLTHPKSGSYFEAIASDGDRAHARTPSFVLVDELWAHKKPDLFRAMRLGAAKVPGSLLVVATTAGRGNDRADFPVYSYAKKVQFGEIVDSSFLPVIFEAPRECDWTDEAVWRAVLPGLEYGYPDLPSLRVLAHEAMERPAEREEFRQFYLGIRAEAANNPFVDMVAYDESAGDPVDLEELAGLPCWLGVDLSSSIDLTVIVAAWSDGTGGHIVYPWFFCPRDNLAQRQSLSGAPYGLWAEEGLIEATPGNVVDTRRVEAVIRDICDRFDVREIAFDPALARDVMSNLRDDGLPAVEMRQGSLTMMPALAELETAVLGRRFRHGGHPVLRTSFANAEAQRNTHGHLVRLTKPRRWLSIDGAVASAMAVARCAAGQGGGSILDDPDFDIKDWIVPLPRW